MTDETNAPVATDGEDTAAVLAQASGQKDYLPEKADAETPLVEGGAEIPGDDAAAATAEAEADKPKRQTAQERIDELTRARREAERDRDFYKEQALQTPKAQPAHVAQDTPHGDGRPDPADYADDFEYVEALTDWKAEQAVERRFAQRSESDRLRSTVESYTTREKTLFPDGDTPGLKAFKQVDTLPAGVFEVIGASDIGPKLAEHLGDNPAELARLATLTPSMQAREMTLLETRLSAPPKATPKTATDAPEPPPQARGQGGQFKVAGDTDDFAAFERQHMPGR